MSTKLSKTAAAAKAAAKNDVLSGVTFGQVNETYLAVSFFSKFHKNTLRSKFCVERQDEVVGGKVADSFYLIQADNCIDEKSIELHLHSDEIRTIIAMLETIIRQ